MSIRKTIIIVLSIFCCLQNAAMAQTGEQEKRKARLEREIAILDRQLKDNASQSASALTKLSLVQNKVRTRKALIKESDSKIAAISAQITRMQKEIDKEQARLDTMTVYYERLIKNAYKNRDARKWYMYILSSESISQGVRRYAFFRNLSVRMNEQAAAICRTRDSLTVQKSRLVSMRNEEQALKVKRQMDLNKVSVEEREAKALSTKLKKEKSRYQKELNSKKNQAAALEREIRKAIGGAMGGGSSKKPKKPIDYTLAKDFVANKGKLPWPVEGSITARFGKQYHPVFKSLKLPDNNGVTLAVPVDSRIKAVFDGVVAQITVLPGYHQCILVQHGDHFTLYSKIKSISVKPGEKVKTGQVLGTVDTINGETTFHFEIWNDKTLPQDPEYWLRPLD